MTELFTGLALLALLLALHPYITYPMSLVALAALRNGKPQPAQGPRRDLDLSQGGPPTIAICLCVHNEEQVIEKRIRNLLDLAKTVPGTEVLVYSDGSTDDTVPILRRFGNRITLVEAHERHGKTQGMNLLVTRTQAQFIIFTDAAVRMTPDALPRMLRHFDDPEVGCVCARIIAENPNQQQQDSATANTSIKYWAFDATIRRYESKVASVIGAHGPLFAIRRVLHEPPPVHLFDDFYVSMAILYNGHRVVQAEDFYGLKAVATQRGDEFQRKVRIACQSFNAHRIMKPRLARQSLLLRYLYASHKTLKWLTIFSLAGAALFGSLAMASAGAIGWLALAWSVFAAGIGLGWLGIKPFSSGLEALSALVGNGVGVWQSMQGKLYQTWASPQSARHVG